jgi:hypothetical protein
VSFGTWGRLREAEHALSWAATLPNKPRGSVEHET